MRRVERPFRYAGERWRAVTRSFPDDRGTLRVRVVFVCEETAEQLPGEVNAFVLDRMSDDELTAALSAAFERADAADIRDR